MEIIKYELNKNVIGNHTIFNDNICFFDIETTGLSRNNDIIYLIGILYPARKDNKWHLVQFFAKDLKDEVNILMEASDTLSSFDTIINYNGNSFDIPFFNHRLKLYDMHCDISLDKSLDLYKIIRKNKDILDLKNYKLRTIEEYLGIRREDLYTGKDCIGFYKDYILTQNPSLKKKILQHNYDDLYYLPKVINILDIIEEKKTFMISSENHNISFIIDNIKIVNDYLTIRGTAKGKIINKVLYYDQNYKVSIDNTGRFEISIEIRKGLISPEEKCIFINKNHFHIEEDRKWIHYNNIPEDLILLKIENKYIIENLKKLSIVLVNKVL